MVCIATGTGIAPFVSYALSHPELNLTLYHGVRIEADLFFRETFSAHRYRACVSGSQKSEQSFAGRVTQAIQEAAVPWPPETHFYLCGANAMILETRRLLLTQGVDDRSIFSEAYYFA